MKPKVLLLILEILKHFKEAKMQMFKVQYTNPSRSRVRLMPESITKIIKIHSKILYKGYFEFLAAL